MKKDTTARAAKRAREATTTVSAEDLTAAREIITLTESSAIPDYIRDAITDALCEAGEMVGAHWTDWSHPEGYDAEALARIIRDTRDYQLQQRAPAERQPPAVGPAELPAPTISYENLINARAAESSARINLQQLAPAFRTPEHHARLQAERLDAQRERFREYEVLGNHFADVLENPDTPAELHNIIAAEMDELAGHAGLHLTAPEVLRLVYPWLRDRVAQYERARVAAEPETT